MLFDRLRIVYRRWERLTRRIHRHRVSVEVVREEDQRDQEPALAVVLYAVDPVDVEGFDIEVFENMDLEVEDRVGRKSLRVEDVAFEEEARRVDSLEKREGDTDFGEDRFVGVCRRRLHRHMRIAAGREDMLLPACLVRLEDRHMDPVEEGRRLVRDTCGMAQDEPY
jgi:hypothetical protein